MPRTTGAVLAVFCLVAGASGADPVALEKLRADYAQRFCEPFPHVALAKYHHDRGNLLLAFYILDEARRKFDSADEGHDSEEHPVGPGTFSDAFDVLFRKREPFDNSPEAEARLAAAFEKDPKSAKIAAQLADIHISHKKLDAGEKLLREAVELDPSAFVHLAALAEVLRRRNGAFEASQLLEGFASRYPQSNEAYAVRLGSLMTTDRPAAKKLLAEALERFPDDGELQFNRGVILQDEKDLPGAEAAFVKASALAPDNAHIQGWTARYFLKVNKVESQALKYYLTAFFLDPNFYDSEFAESRIRKLGYAAAQRVFDKLRADGAPAERLFSHENPVVVELALEEASKSWQPGLKSACLKLLTHDDESVRWQATQLLMENVESWPDAELTKLLKDPDARKRGLAAYVAVHAWKEKAFPLLEPWLNETSQLLRFDAISALFQYGGDGGIKIVRAHEKRESHPYLKKVLEGIDK